MIKSPQKRQQGGVSMKVKQIRPNPMTEDQLKQLKKEIIRIYLFLISHTTYDPMVVEVMKLSALSDVQRRYEMGETWSKDN
jgi:hypothetical protein